ncbi:hypothetical protein P5808_24710 [Bacillus cereus]|uniref:hypothetical protein n=1 Tax=Bacillus cereus TaxID=1396 RepID=UPI00240533AC|nr:hypothetical protein [Bacillus cereus]MDF9505066.1 hypothetical protein [Bacillus cereus]MDF9597182.1 hypothetical protein [Bacillus cereus]MDF9609008.1 hypothetical protein [Bacillus cereus]MDF9660222.1 hypothetical protein [Bacillus cereus]
MSNDRYFHSKNNQKSSKLRPQCCNFFPPQCICPVGPTGPTGPTGERGPQGPPIGNGQFIQFPVFESPPQPCSPITAGAVFFNSSIGKLQVCTGTSWETIVSTDMATLIVRTFLLDETAPNLIGGPAGEGVYIRVNGEMVGITGPDGTLTIQVPSGALIVEAIVPSFSQGEALLTLAVGSTGVANILLDDGKEVIEPSALVLTESVEGVLPKNSSSITLYFEQDGELVVLERLDQVELLDRDGNLVESLDSFFEISGGNLVATDVLGVIEALQPQAAHQISIRFTGVDTLGFTHSDTVRFYLGQFQLVGTLVPPPSNPSLNIANLPVEVKLLGTPIVFTRNSDANGRFEIESVPIGNIEFNSQTFEDSSFYYGQGTFFLSEDRVVFVIMRNVVDIVNGVPPLTLDSIDGLNGGTALAVTGVSDETMAERASLDSTLSLPMGKVALTASENTVSVQATAGQEGLEVSDIATLTIPKGTQTITLKYNVFSFEYPTFVLAGSVFNDVWSLAVYGGQFGEQLFEVTRNVNSQVFVPPIWQPDSSTGDITKILDVSALTTNGDTTLTLFASSTNIGDSALPTIVNATLTSEVKLTIDEIIGDIVQPTIGDSTYYSIPRPGMSNFFQRWFTLTITKPSEAEISQVRVILRGQDNLMTLLDEGPGPNIEIQTVDEQRLRIRVRVSMHSKSSTVSSTPPPTDAIAYRFRVQANLNGETLEDEKESGILHGLWKMPDIFVSRRYGTRDLGGDDWCSQGCYLWLENNANLITRIDDISGEHGRNIGHKSSHARGVDIDMFHFYTFPDGGVSGGTNYEKLLNNVIGALSGDIGAGQRVGNWIKETRDGLGKLLAKNEVSCLYYAIGDPNNKVFSLASGWAQSLIQTGRVTTKNGELLETGLGIWSEATNKRVKYNSVHNTHIHIALNSNLL